MSGESEILKSFCAELSRYSTEDPFVASDGRWYATNGWAVCRTISDGHRPTPPRTTPNPPVLELAWPESHGELIHIEDLPATQHENSDYFIIPIKSRWFRLEGIRLMKGAGLSDFSLVPGFSGVPALYGTNVRLQALLMPTGFVGDEPVDELCPEATKPYGYLRDGKWIVN